MSKAIRMMIMSAGVLAAVGAGAEPVTPAQKTDLFNGRDFEGWNWFLTEPAAKFENTWCASNSVIRCTGAPFGYLATKTEYKDYKLHVEWRWAGEPGNSGVFLHKTGPDAIWPNVLEAQLKNGRAGDWVLLGGREIKGNPGKKNRGVPHTAGASAEKPAGEWNTLDVVAKADTAEVRVNGKLMNTAEEVSVRSGFICLQSEGGIIEFRNVYVEPVK